MKSIVLRKEFLKRKEIVLENTKRMFSKILQETKYREDFMKRKNRLPEILLARASPLRGWAALNANYALINSHRCTFKLLKTKDDREP